MAGELVVRNNSTAPEASECVQESPSTKVGNFQGRTYTTIKAAGCIASQYAQYALVGTFVLLCLVAATSATPTSSDAESLGTVTFAQDWCPTGGGFGIPKTVTIPLTPEAQQNAIIPFEQSLAQLNGDTFHYYDMYKPVCDFMDQVTNHIGNWSTFEYQAFVASAGALLSPTGLQIVVVTVVALVALGF